MGLDAPPKRAQLDEPVDGGGAVGADRGCDLPLFGRRLPGCSRTADEPGGPDHLDTLEEIYRRHREPVYRYLLRKTRDPERAQDLTQDVFTEATAALPQVVGHPTVLAWLYTVARRRLADEYRRSASRQETPLPRDLASTGAREVDLLSSQFAHVFVDSVLRLPAAQRRVLLMRLFEGRSFREIASELLADEPACRARCERALRTLRKHLREAGLDG